MSEFESTGKISPRQLLLRLHGDIMPLLEVVIRGQEPSTQDAHLKFLQSTTLQREQALSEVRFKGDWSDSLLEKISDFCTKWCCRESLGRDVEVRRVALGALECFCLTDAAAVVASRTRGRSV